MVRKTFLFSLLYFTSALCAPSVTLDLSGIRFLRDNGKIKPTVFLGETFTLQATIVGGRENVRIKGLEQFITHGTNQSSNVSVDNSNLLIEQTINYKLWCSHIRITNPQAYYICAFCYSISFKPVYFKE